LIDEAIELLNNEIRIVKWRIKYPEQFQQNANGHILSPFHLADKTNLINIMEIVSGLFLSQRIIKNDNPAYLTDLTKAFATKSMRMSSSEKQSKQRSFLMG